ncbi:CHAT domain-containing protein [Paractinoplanes maris]|uniref:CHAT domain-containing protein n=1 Tax=Paractinoplanes maris TaxID=1734446 RepID=UPI002021A8D7|nr:CHAT domain-containing protein [Actinoplanes maris]
MSRESGAAKLNATVAGLERRAAAMLAQHGDGLPPDALDTIIDALSSVTDMPGVIPEVAGRASVTLGFALKSRYMAQLHQTSSTADIDRSIAIYRAAALREGADYALLSNLAQAYLARSVKAHDVATARNTLLAHAYALDAVSAADPHFASAVEFAATLVQLPLVDHRGDVGLETLAASLLRAQRIAVRGSRSAQECARALYGLGERLLIRYADGGTPSHLEHAIAALTGAIPGLAAEPGAFVVLGLAFSQRAALRGPERGGEDLDAAVTAMRTAMRLATTGEQRHDCAAHLVAFLVHRFETSRQRDDLDEAITLGMRVQAQSGEAGPAAKKFCTPLLEKALTLRAQLDNSAGDAQRAYLLRHFDPRLTDFHDDERRADRPMGKLKRIFREPYLTLAQKRREHTHPDLELAAETEQEIDRLTEAITGATDDTTRSQIREALVDALSGQYIARPDTRGLDELINQSALLIEELPATDAEHRADHRIKLAYALRQRYDTRGRAADLDATAEHLRPVLDDERLPTWHRFAAAVQLGQAEAQGGRWPGAREALGGAVNLLPLFAGRQLAPDDHLREVADWSEVASDAAAAAVRAGAVEHALELLERGRGLLLGRALDYRETFEHIRTADPEQGPRLIEELRRLGTQLAAPRGPGGVDHRRATVAAWNRTVDSIRRLPGCGDFLAPVTVRDLHPAAAGGPVVTVNISRYGSHALVLTATTVEAVPLPDATVEAVREQETVFFDALAFAELSPADPAATHDAQEPLRDVLAWLGSAVVGPVMAHLGRSGPVPARIWWVPTGNLATLPLHAAELGEGRSALDRTVSSYAPTVTSLARAGRRPGPPALGEVHLIAGGPSSLAGATAEVDRLVEHFPDAHRILGADATRSRVAAALRTSSWLHIACHATSYWNAPIRSALHLHDGPLTVGDLLADRAPRGELVYLSACETVLSSTVAAAEVMHLGTAFHVAGYRQVIGTLWRVTDGTAAETARLFYDRLGSPPQAGTASRALHETAQELRRRYPGLPTRWAAYVHIGP